LITLLKRDIQQDSRSVSKGSSKWAILGSQDVRPPKQPVA